MQHYTSGVVGLMIGSFLNVVIYRLPKIMEIEWSAQCAEFRGEVAPFSEPLSLSLPRSRCPRCGHQITALENIPVISWLFLQGKCSSCKNEISSRYPSIEMATSLLTLLAASHFGYTWAAGGAFVLIWSLIALACIDFDTQLLPDSITGPLLWAGLVFNLFGTYVDLQSAVIGAIAGYLSLWSIYWGFKLATGKDGMGYGDFKLLGVIGAWLGWQMLPLVIVLSSVVGAIAGLGLMLLLKKGKGTQMPFGPYLATAGLVALLWGAELTQNYLRLPI